jgi:maltooligosyltrehalose trehalohydrolase
VGQLLWVRHQSGAGERVLLWHTGLAGDSGCALAELGLPFGLPARLLLHSEGREATPDTLHPGEAVILAADGVRE